MENRQINFFKSKDFNTVLKPFKKGTVVKIDSLDIRENQNELKIGLFGWYAICPSKELKKNKLNYFSLYNEPLVLYRDENENVRCIKNICPHRGSLFFRRNTIRWSYNLSISWSEILIWWKLPKSR